MRRVKTEVASVESLGVDFDSATSQVLQTILDRLNEYVEGSADRAQLCLLAEITYDEGAVIVSTTRSALLESMAKVANLAGRGTADARAAEIASKAIRAKTAKDEIPILFVGNGFPGGGLFVQTASAHYVAQGMTKGGQA